MERIYLDNAATSWPKPDGVYEAVMHAMRELGSSAGRGGYASAIRAGQVVYQAREAVARVLGAEAADRIVLTQNGTDALNLAIHGFLRPGDHVVTSDAEHNSVLRPLAAAARRFGVRVTHVPCDGTGIIAVEELERALTDTTRLVAVTHASNVTGAIQPVAEIVAVAHRVGAKVLVDAAQSVGHAPLAVADAGWDFVACSGHKGLLGPLGTGVLYIRPGLEEELQPLRQGGTGLDSQSDAQPDALPEKLEAGNLNVPALAGLAVAARQVAGYVNDPDEVARESRLLRLLLDGLQSLSGITHFGPPADAPRTPVVSIQVAGYDPQELACMLDSAGHVEARAGLHCAPRMHRSLGTDQSGGTLRLSLGRFNTTEQITHVIELLSQLCLT